MQNKIKITYFTLAFIEAIFGHDIHSSIFTNVLQLTTINSFQPSTLNYV